MNVSIGRSISFGAFTLYPDARVLERDGARLALGSRALDILIVLTERAGKVVSHKELNQRVWRGIVVTAGSLRTHIAGLRKALSEGGTEFRHIANVPGQGYCFVAPVTRLDAHCTPEIVSRPHLAEERHDLTHQRTTLVGRENGIESLGELFTSARLLTLTGAGNTGLALKLLAKMLEGFSGGCWLVDFAAAGEPTQVAETVGTILGISEQGDRSFVQAVAARPATKCLLFLLDNAARQG